MSFTCTAGAATKAYPRKSLKGTRQTEFGLDDHHVRPANHSIFLIQELHHIVVIEAVLGFEKQQSLWI